MAEGHQSDQDRTSGRHISLGQGLEIEIVTTEAIYLATVWALPVIIAITFHEAAHGFVAHLLGDDTAWRLGRVSFNPLKHIDPFGTILLPAILLLLRSPFLFGYAKPVPVNLRTTNVRHGHFYRRAKAHQEGFRLCRRSPSGFAMPRPAFGPSEIPPMCEGSRIFSVTRRLARPRSTTS
jgi:hypothetical protein